MNTLKAMLALAAERVNMFRIPLFRLLPTCMEEQLLKYNDRFVRFSTDACFFGIGGFCFDKECAGYYFRKTVPAWLTRQMEERMKSGHDGGDSSLYSIAILEKAANTLAQWLFGKGGRCCYHFWQDNQNVVDWVNKGWSKPLLAQF